MDKAFTTTAQYAEYAADVARELVRIRQDERETPSELVNRVQNLAKIAFKDVVQTDREAIQSQQVETRLEIHSLGPI